MEMGIDLMSVEGEGSSKRKHNLDDTDTLSRELDRDLIKETKFGSLKRRSCKISRFEE